MPLLTPRDEFGDYKPSRWAFWRNLAVYFCVFSVVGHWIEIVYCLFMRLFGIYDPASLVWGDPFYPFMVYGIGSVVCTLLLDPLKEAVIRRRKTIWGAALQFFLITTIACMLMELTMGFMLNQPNEFGIYPLWDNSQLPLNILKQAWLVNDVMLGMLSILYIWGIYPMNEKILSKVPERTMNVASIIVVVGFVALCIVEFN